MHSQTLKLKDITAVMHTVSQFLKLVYKKRLLWVLLGMILLRDFFNQNKVKFTKNQ